MISIRKCDAVEVTGLPGPPWHIAGQILYYPCDYFHAQRCESCVAYCREEDRIEREIRCSGSRVKIVKPPPVIRVRKIRKMGCMIACKQDVSAVEWAIVERVVKKTLEPRVEFSEDSVERVSCQVDCDDQTRVQFQVDVMRSCGMKASGRVKSHFKNDNKQFRCECGVLLEPGKSASVKSVVSGGRCFRCDTAWCYQQEAKHRHEVSELTVTHLFILENGPEIFGIQQANYKYDVTKQYGYDEPPERHHFVWAAAESVLCVYASDRTRRRVKIPIGIGSSYRMPILGLIGEQYAYMRWRSLNLVYEPWSRRKQKTKLIVEVKLGDVKENHEYHQMSVQTTRFPCAGVGWMSESASSIELTVLVEGVVIYDLGVFYISYTVEVWDVWKDSHYGLRMDDILKQMIRDVQPYGVLSLIEARKGDSIYFTWMHGKSVCEDPALSNRLKVIVQAGEFIQEYYAYKHNGERNVSCREMFSELVQILMLEWVVGKRGRIERGTEQREIFERVRGVIAAGLGKLAVTN